MKNALSLTFLLAVFLVLATCSLFYNNIPREESQRSTANYLCVLEASDAILLKTFIIYVCFNNNPQEKQISC